LLFLYCFVDEGVEPVGKAINLCDRAIHLYVDGIGSSNAQSIAR
jgi:hypothetical protein